MFVILSRLIGESTGVGTDAADEDNTGDRIGDSGDEEGDGDGDETDGSDEVRSQLSISFLLLIPPLFSLPILTSRIM